MKKYLAFIFFVISVLLLVYVYPKSPEFPKPPEGVVQSDEPADVESAYRRGYYTNLNRQEVIAHYEQEFNRGFSIYTPRLNYPPEDSPLLIRDQTKTTYLEEITHPLRESIYINGFEPKSEEYAQYFRGDRYSSKIIIRYVTSPVWVRLFVILASGISGYFLVLEYINAKKRN